jgi:hypothetical protein
MPLKNNHSDPATQKEFIEVWKKADLYIVSETEPKNPKSGTMWYKPSTNDLKIFNGAWNSH